MIIAAYDELLANLPEAVIDLTTVFHGMAELPYYDPVHFNAPGHSEFANAMFPHVLDMIDEDD